VKQATNISANENRRCITRGFRTRREGEQQSCDISPGGLNAG
jgi:hypothetical protein